MNGRGMRTVADIKAEEYADAAMRGNGGDVFTRADLREYIREAYLAGWERMGMKENVAGDVTELGDSYGST